MMDLQFKTPTPDDKARILTFRREFNAVFDAMHGANELNAFMDGGFVGWINYINAPAGTQWFEYQKVADSTYGSCSIYSNHKTANALDTQIKQKQAIIADLNKPINAATATQLSNLVTIEQTRDGIKIKSRHPQATETINSRGLTSSLDEKALIIKR